MSFPNIDYKEMVDDYLGGNHILIKDKKRYFLMDGHLFTMPLDEEVGINAVMKAVSEIRTTWEPNTTKMVKEKIKEGMICLDIGASIGYFTLLLARCVGKTGRVLSFEPTPNQVPYTLNNIKVNGYEDRVKFFPIAAWDNKDGIMMPPGNRKYMCPSTPIDDILEEEGIIDKIDFIKIDVDGSEAHVLRGLDKTFKLNPNLQIMFEYYPRCIIHYGGENPETIQKMVEKYFTHEIIPDDIHIQDGSNWWCKRKCDLV